MAAVAAVARTLASVGPALKDGVSSAQELDPIDWDNLQDMNKRTDYRI